MNARNTEMNKIKHLLSRNRCRRKRGVIMKITVIKAKASGEVRVMKFISSGLPVVWKVSRRQVSSLGNCRRVMLMPENKELKAGS